MLSLQNGSRAGFGISKRSGTPEPWTKRLADDGMTYYYFNKLSGDIQWTRPAASADGTSVPSLQLEDYQQNGRSALPAASSSASGLASTNDTLLSDARLRADSVTSQNNASSKRDSVYSDDSDIHPRESDGLERPTRTVNKVENAYAYDREITPSERAAYLLQDNLTPAEPESIDKLADRTREAIIVVMASVDADGLPKGPDHDKEVVQNVSAVVVAVRNLLYVSCALSGPLPSALGERDTNATAVAQQLQAQLKSSQRKVTATLSKLVLSARAARYKREAFSPEMMMRVEQDAADLQRAVDNFVAEVKKQYSRTAIKQLHQRIGRKRLRGVFDLQYIGVGLPGAGVAASWKGFGCINVDEGLGLPKMSLNDTTINEARNLLRDLDDRLADLLVSLQDAETTQGKFNRPR